MDLLASGPISLTTPFGASLRLGSMTGTEMLGVPFEYHLELFSDDPTLNIADLLSLPVTVNLELGPGIFRYFHGYATEVSLLEADRDVNAYFARVQAWPAFMAHRTDCRIFQDQSIPDIVKSVLDEYHAQYELKVSPGYPLLEYVVQYRESDLAFVSRLLEEAGIYYFFRHEADKHTMVLVDSMSAHAIPPNVNGIPASTTSKKPSYPVPFRHTDDHRARLVEHVESWRLLRKLQSGGVAARDFNFLTSRANMEVRVPSTDPSGEVLPSAQIFDYPGGYPDPDLGQEVVRRKMELLTSSHAVVTAETNARPLSVGSLFNLTDHPNPVENGEYLVTSARFRLQPHDPRAGEQDEHVYRCQFTAISSSRVFRPPLTTRKPVMGGPQTAIVVGGGTPKPGTKPPPAGSDPKPEIETDPYGRVKVQFHWDRYGTYDRNSSCWIRVSQVWAGSNWGAMHIPRIGQEVIVDFLEGDPDRPIITGRVYNNATMPPYTLPKHKTQSGIKSHSTKGGEANNFNEIRFEDLKGSEELHIQAEKDQSTLVKNNQTITVHGNRSVTVGGKETITVQKERDTTVVKKDTLKIQDKHEMTVTDLVTQTFNNGHFLNVYTADQHIEIGEGKTEHVGKVYNLTTDEEYKLTQGKTTFTFVGDTVRLNAGDKISVESPTSISFKVGDNLIAISPAGVEITANEIILTVKSTKVDLTATTATVEADADITLKVGASKVDMSPAATNVTATVINLNS